MNKNIVIYLDILCIDKEIPNGTIQLPRPVEIDGLFILNTFPWLLNSQASKLRVLLLLL